MFGNYEGGYLGPGIKGIDQGGVPGSHYRDQGSNDYDDKYGWNWYKIILNLKTNSPGLEELQNKQNQMDYI